MWRPANFVNGAQAGGKLSDFVYSLVSDAMWVAGSARPMSGSAWMITQPRTNGLSNT